MERFWKYGLDFADATPSRTIRLPHEKHPAYGMGSETPRTTRDRPRAGYGLSEAICHDKKRAVCLLLWAGADPHSKVPSMMWSQTEDADEEEGYSAIEQLSRTARENSSPDSGLTRSEKTRCSLGHRTGLGRGGRTGEDQAPLRLERDDTSGTSTGMTLAFWDGSAARQLWKEQARTISSVFRAWAGRLLTASA